MASSAASAVDRLVTIISALIDRDYAVGDRLPSESVLAEITGRSRASVREALARLANDGVIERRWGTGTFVHRRPGRVGPMATPLSVGLPGRIAQAGFAPSVARVEVDRRPTPPRWLDAYDHGEVWRVRRVFAADGEPVSLVEDLIPLVLGGVELDVSGLDRVDVLLNDVFVAAGSRLERIDFQWRAAVSDAPTTAAFDLAAPEPVLVGEGIGHGPDGGEITITRSAHRTSIIPLSSTLWVEDPHRAPSGTEAPQ